MPVTQARETAFTRWLKNIPEWLSSRESSGRSARGRTGTTTSYRPRSTVTSRPKRSRTTSASAATYANRGGGYGPGSKRPTATNPNAGSSKPGAQSTPGNKVTGVYRVLGGNPTKSNILAWQKKYNSKLPKGSTPIKEDGIIGRQTLRAMGLQST